jgi:hypothetical protein
MRALAERRVTQREVAGHLGLGVRQVQRLRDAFVESGPEGLVSSGRGKPSNRRLAQSYRDQVLDIVRAQYAGFGPTLAHEKLVEQHGGLAPALETLRVWMAAAGLWRTRKERRKRPQPPRARRACVGELIQIDGSDHEWFEDRGPRCTLLVLFTWQEERRLTDNLTLHYKRVMYIVEACAAAEAARGKRVAVIETEDGAVRVEFRGEPLAARAFPKDARVSQAAADRAEIVREGIKVPAQQFLT